MTRLCIPQLIVALTVSLTCLGAPTLAFADGPGDRHTNGLNGKGHDNHKGHGYGHHKAKGVPEIDPSAAGAALALLVGGVLVMTGRRRKSASAV